MCGGMMILAGLVSSVCVGLGQVRVYAREGEKVMGGNETAATHGWRAPTEIHGQLIGF